MKRTVPVIVSRKRKESYSNHMYTEQQVQHMLYEQEQRLRREYDQMLEQQWQAFVQYHQAHLMERMKVSQHDYFS